MKHQKRPIKNFPRLNPDIGYKPKYFKATEFLPEVIYRSQGEAALCFLDSRILYTADMIHVFFNDEQFKEKFPFAGTLRRIWCNNWHWGGRGHNRAFTPPWISRSQRLTQHFCGRALNLVIEGIPADVVCEIIMENQARDQFRYLQHISNYVDFLYIDCAQSNQPGIIEVMSKEYKNNGN